MKQLRVVATVAAIGLPMLTSVALAQDAGTANPPPAAETPPAATTPPPAAEELPAVNVVQETPVQKAARAKKKAVAVSPLSSAPAPAPAPTTAAATAAPAAESNTEAVAVETPLPTVPSASTTVSDDDIKREGTMQVQQALQQQVPGVIISDAAGNPMRAEVSFRGFDASPVSGRSQGLAVYQNGIRINESFGDTVQWDVIPSNAIASTSIVSNNPSFGLNALGGAASILMKDGFSYEGGEIDVMAGSFGRAQIGLQAGVSSGGVGLYVAGEGITDDSFRDFSDSEVKRFYGDLGLKGDNTEIHFSLTAAKNHFGASAAAPVELLERSWSNTFTTPQTTDLEVLMPTISGKVQATETLTFAGAAYYRRYKNRVVDGNITEADECEDLPDGASGAAEEYLCLDDGEGNPLRNDNLPNNPYVNVVDEDLEEPFGTLDRLNTTSRSWGGVLEAQERAKLFDRPNLFIAGVSYDRGRSNYTTSSELGEIGDKYVVEGAGIIITDDDGDPGTTDDLGVGPRDLTSNNTYFGLYFSNALDVTDQLTLTFGGRYNHATIKLQDNTGLFDGLNVTNKYDRFNPMVGANYKLLPGLAVYGGYSESNRAPTPAELGCAEETAPCLVEGFLTDDPPLDQVVGRTAEVGVRGQSYNNGDRFSWSAGLFRTLASDDILPVTGTNGRVFFENAGDTLRQGVELSATYEASRWSTYASYALVDATLDSCSDESGECAFLEAGDRLPGIPRHRFKAGFEYWLTPKWKFGADLVATSNQPLYPNEVSDTLEDEGEDFIKKLAGYTRVDLHTSYDITDNVQVYGLIKNVFDKKYGLYGTFFEAGDVPDLDNPLLPPDEGFANFNDPRTISPAMPFAAYGGVKIKF